MYHNSNMEIVCEGWLNEWTQAEKKLFRTKSGSQKMNRRWFVLKQSGEIPGQYLLDYYTDSTCKKQKGRVDLDQCRRIDRKMDTRCLDVCLFSIETGKRTYNLLAGSKEELNKWIQCLCTVCGFKPLHPDTQLQLSLDNLQKDGKKNDVILISYSNPNLSNEHSSSPNSSPTGKNLTNNQSSNQMAGQPGQSKERSSAGPEANSRCWMNYSSTLNRTVNKLTNSTNCSLFSSATLPTRKTDISSGYIPISECHTGSKSIFESSPAENKKSTKNGQLIDASDDQDSHSIRTQFDCNKENKFADRKNCKSLLDSSLSSTHDLLLDTASRSRSPNLSNEDCDTNYDVPRQMHKKSRIKDLLNIVAPKEECLYANAKSMPGHQPITNLNNHLNRSPSARSSTNEYPENNYLNVSQNLERQRSLNEREYYNNVAAGSQQPFEGVPPPRPPKPRSIELGRRDKSTSLNSLNEQNDLNEFDPLNCVPKPPPASLLATSPDQMYSIPKSQIELELEKQNSRRRRTATSSLDMVVPITHNRFTSNGGDELHRYTNAAGDVFSKSIDGHAIIYEYEKPSLPVNNNLTDLNSLNDNLDKFKIPSIRLNDKTEPMTPSLIVTSTPLFPDGQPERHFNFSEQNDAFNKPQVNRDLKPKKSDTSIESLLVYTNKSPNSRQHSDTLINRTNLSASFNCKPSSSNLNLPRVPSRGRQFGSKIASSLEGEQFIEDIIKAKKDQQAKKQSSDFNEIQYLDLDLDCTAQDGDNVSLNSTMNETSTNLNFRDVERDLANTSILNSNRPSSNLNSSFNATGTLNYSHFTFPNKNDTGGQLSGTLNGSFGNNASTVYKTVDFVKTKALNQVKDTCARKD